MSALTCRSTAIVETIDHLRTAGRGEQECIVLWLGRRSAAADTMDIQEVRRPRQTARRDRFYIPPDEMAALKVYLRENRLIIAAQVHSHPAEAFHSLADDTGAIVRHVGALSFVVPWFASKVCVSSFFSEAVLFELQEDNSWLEIPKSYMGTKCQIIS
jgi:hypothetical protein